MVQLVGSAPKQAGRTSAVEETAKARLATHTGAAHPHGWPPKCQCTLVGRGGSPPSSPDRGTPDSDGYSTVSETTGCQCRCRGHRGSREKKQLAPTRLDMPIFKSTDLGAEVTYTLWRFNADAFLEQYDEASMRPHIFASLCGYPGKWAYTLDEGKDISVQNLLMHMEKTFGNKRDYDAMIRTLYEVQQKEDETMEEYMLRIHDAVMVICRAYLERLPDWGRDLKKDCFYHGLRPTFMMPSALQWQNCLRESKPTPHLTHCTLSQKSEKLGFWHVHASMLPARMFIERSIGATLCWQEEWQPWRRKGWR